MFQFLCNNSDRCDNISQIPWEVLKTPSASVFNTSHGTWRMLMHEKPCLIPILCEKKAIPQEFKDATLSTYSKGKGTLKSVTFIKASLYCRLPRRSLLESYWIDWMNSLNSQGFYEKVNVDSTKRQRNNRHDLYSWTAPREMPGTECWPLHDLCRPYQSISHSQSWGTLEDYGKVWLSCKIHSNGAAVPRWYACKGPKWWRVVFIHSLWQIELSKVVY